jgi:hypothetical protein
VGGDLRRKLFPDFERTIPIGKNFRSRNGGQVVLMSVDLWSDRVGLNFAYEQTTPFLIGRDGYLIGRDGYPHAVDWSITDDRGTTFQWRGGGSGGADDFCIGYALFTPAVPDAADHLLISSPELPRPIEVPLAP